MASSSRSRPKKVGTSRMDAALEHLRPWGFSKQEISRTVKSLLKEYGGDAGWYFLEEDGYKLVVETIIDKQHVTTMEEPLPQLPAPPSPAPEKKNEEEQRQNGDSDAEMGMKEQGFCNGSIEVAMLAPSKIKFMDENLLHVIPPGWRRAPLYGYLSETDSDADFDAGSP